MHEKQRSLDSDKRKDRSPSPAAHLKGRLPESGIAFTGSTACPQCNGSGFDSSAKQVACCSCSGLGEVLECAGKLFDYREMREAVETLKQTPERDTPKSHCR